MSCSKCSEVFELLHKPANIYFMSEIEELMLKSKLFIEKIGMQLNESNQINFIKVEDAHDFFHENFDAIKNEFNELESQNIKLSIQDETQEFNFQSILGAKSLQRYINLIEDREFFDILNNQSLTSYFQPIIKASDRSIYGYEALIRGVKENGELMFPDDLFEKSERNDLNFMEW